MGFDWQQWTIIATIAAPLIVIALGTLGRLTIHVILAWRAADWWNHVLNRAHDRNQKMFEEETKMLDQAQDIALALPDRPSDADLTYLAYQEMTRMRARIEQIRIEEQARHDAVSSRSQFSDFRIVWQWLRYRNEPNATLDTGTTTRFMSDQEPTEMRGPGHNTTPTQSSPVATSKSPTSHRGSLPDPANLPQTSSVARVPIMTPATFVEEELLRRLNLLEVLASQRDRGILTPEEFAEQKAKLLNG